MELEIIKKYCLFCDKSIDPLKGRRDRKFCNDACRIGYHNRKIQSRDKEIMRINQILERNFEILKESLANQRSVTVARETMLRRGFSFDYYTQVYQEYKFCYGFG